MEMGRDNLTKQKKKKIQGQVKVKLYTPDYKKIEGLTRIQSSNLPDRAIGKKQLNLSHHQDKNKIKNYESCTNSKLWRWSISLYVVLLNKTLQTMNITFSSKKLIVFALVKYKS